MTLHEAARGLTFSEVAAHAYTLDVLPLAVFADDGGMVLQPGETYVCSGEDQILVAAKDAAAAAQLAETCGW